MMLMQGCNFFAIFPRKATFVGILFLSLFLGFSASSFAESPAPDRELVIGKVSDNPKKHYPYLKPMVDYLVSHMQDLGYTKGTVKMANDNEQMVRYLEQGRIDMVSETAFAAMKFQEEAGADLLVRKWKKGVPEYHSIIFVRKDSGIKRLSDLVGKTIAFEDPGSTSAYYVPAATLLQQGLKLELLDSPRQLPRPGYIGYVFSNEEINSAMWVHKGRVAAAAISNIDWNKDDYMPQGFQPDFEILYASPSMPRAIDLVRGDLEPEVKARIKQLLLNMHLDPEAASVLKSYQRTKKFDELTEAIWADMGEIKQTLAFVEQELN